MNRIKNTIALAVALMLLPVGCALTPDQANIVCPQVESISFRTGQRVLDSNNNTTTRQAIGSAVVTLREASRSPQLSFDTLAAIITSLPIGQLQNEDTRLYVDIATLAIILLLPNGAEVDVSEYESAQIIASCIANGLEQALH